MSAPPTPYGTGDQLGSVNRLTRDAVLNALNTARSGAVFPLTWRLDLPDPPILGRGRFGHQVIDLGNGYDDYYAPFYPQASSQWDALSHFRHPDSGFYNGFTAEQIRGRDDPALGIDRWARTGIVGRFVLVDVAAHVARHGGVLDNSTRFALGADTLAQILDEQSSPIGEGDILLLHFGWTRWYESLEQREREALAGHELFFPAPGLAQGEEMVQWLSSAGLGAIAADVPALEATPFDPHSADCLHATLIPLLGLAVGELFDLAALAADCAGTGHYDGLFVSAPLNIPGGAGSPANAVAIT